jgi:D-aspartate ligase
MCTKKPFPNNIKTGAIIIEGHVQGLSNTRSLGEIGIPIYVVDKTNCIARYSKYCKKFFLCPDFYKDEFAEFLINLAEKENIKDWILLPSNDHAVYTISKHKSILERYYKIITPGLDIIEKIYDKSKLLAIAERCQIPIPATQCLKSTEGKIGKKLAYPVITKGRHGLSFYKAVGKKALLAENEKELRSHLKLIDKKYGIDHSLTQELIPFDGTNHTISFTSFCVNGEIKAYWMGEKLREHPQRFGTATFARSVYVEKCHHQSIPLLKELHYTGVCEVEYILDPRDKEYKLIEINARTWLWVGLAKACGVDFARIIYEYVYGMEIDYPINYETGICWINPITDTAYAVKDMFKGHLSPVNYIKSVLNGKKVNALFAKNDLQPGFVYLFNLFNYLKNR